MIRKIELNIQGMHCASCSKIIEMTVTDLIGVESISVNLLTNKASVSIDEYVISIDSVIKAVDGCGYKAELIDDEKKKS